MLPDPSPMPEGDRTKPFFGPVQFGGADLSYMAPGEIKFMRQGLIPCRRCAFFVPIDRGLPQVLEGFCALNPVTVGKLISDGCGQGLLREEASPLPPEVR